MHRTADTALRPTSESAVYTTSGWISGVDLHQPGRGRRAAGALISRPGFRDDFANCSDLISPGARTFRHVDRFDIDRAVRSSFLRLLRTGPAHAFAGEIDAMGVVNEAIEDCVGIGWIADDFMPAFDGELRGNGRAAPIALFEDFEEVVPAAAASGFNPQSSRMRISVRPRVRKMRGWRPWPRARARACENGALRSLHDGLVPSDEVANETPSRGCATPTSFAPPWLNSVSLSERQTVIGKRHSTP